MPTPVDSTGTGGFSYRFVKCILQIISNYNKFLQILSNYLHISNIFCNFASSFGNEPEAATRKLTKKNEIMKATTALKNLEKVANNEKSNRNWKLTAAWKLIIEALKGREYHGYLYFKKDGKIRPCYYSGSGRFASKMNYTADVQYLLDKAGIRYTLTNDAPRGGETGNLITMTHIEY